MPYEFKVTRRVEFSDTDMAGIMHFSNFFRFMETAEHAFIRSLGFSVVLEHFNPPLGLPRVHAACDYKAPLHFEDEVEIHLLVQHKKLKSLSYQFRFIKLNATPPVEVARGSLTVVCATRLSNGQLTAMPLPQALAEQIHPAPKALLEG